MSFLKVLTEERRLSILQLLEGQPGYTLNDGVVHEGLKRRGYRCSRGQVREDFAWLNEHGLLEMEALDDDLCVVTLKSLGQSVALGDATHAGVKRPSAK